MGRDAENCVILLVLLELCRVGGAPQSRHKGCRDLG
jgi:hypothetical protein